MKLSVSLFILFYISPSDGAETGRDLSSLTFVIDITPSMKDDIDEVRRDVYEIFETVYNHNASQIDNFILVTFKDEGPHNRYRCNSNASVAVRTKTRDHETFKTALFSITLQSGFPFCEECPMSGIKRAIEESLPRSMIYVFTDATAKDYYMYKEVKNMAQAKGCQIVYALTGQCSEPETSPKYKVYTDSAEATGGRVFNVNKGEINKVLNYVKKTITGRRTTPIDKSLTPGVHSIPFNADLLMGEVILSFTSSTPNVPTVNVKAPDGTTVPTSDVMHTAKAQVYSFNVTKSGIHTLEVNTGAVTRAEVSAESGVDFKHGFSAYKLPSIVDTSTRPAPGAKSYLSINLNEGDITLKSVQILDLDDKELLKLPLVLSNNATKFYTTEAFDPPTTPFRIAIVGCTAAKECNIFRKEPSPVEVDSISPGSVTNKAASITELETKINVNYSEPVQITCKVNAYPKPKITWRNKETGKKIDNKTLPGTTYPYDHVNILYIESATENATYVCEARNTMGSSSKKVIVEVAPKRYLTIIHTFKNVTTNYETEGIISCSVDAYPPAKITWYKEGKEVTPNDNIDIQTSGQESIISIKNSTLADEGKYTCEANNEDTVQSIDVHFVITGLESPEINKLVTNVIASKGFSTMIECEIIKGKPRPSISWHFGDSAAEKWKNQEKVVIDNADKTDTGVYKCQAQNLLGKDQHEINLLVEYAPVIINNDVTKELITVKTYTKVSISCNVDGVPAPDVKWFKNDVIIINSTKTHIYDNYTLSFTAVPSEAGDYKCLARNKHGSDQKNVQVYVTVPAFIRPIPIPRLNKTLQVGTSQSILVCIVTGEPKPEISWIFQDLKASEPMPKGNTEKLILTNISTKDEGSYTCIANNSAGSDMMTYSVHVVEDPEIDQSQEKEVFVEITKSIELKCKILKGIPKPTITWSFKLNNGDKDSSERFHEITEWKNQETITIENAQLNNSGLYRCKAENPVLSVYLDVNLVVEYPPEILIDKTKEKDFMKPLKGSKVTIPCNVDGVPPPQVTWTKDGMRILNDGKPYRFGLQALKFDAEIVHSGRYTCKATNKLGSVEKTVKVDIIEPPAIIELPLNTSIAVRVGDNLNLTCVVKGFPKPDIKWTYQDFGAPEPSNKIFKFSKDNSLIINRIQIKDAGYYTCTALNKGGSANVTYGIQVFSPPAITNTYKDNQFVAVVGDLVLRIDCNATGSPIPTISWKKDGLSLALGPNYVMKEGTLFILDVPEDAGGSYSCEAQNEKGNAQQSFEVIVQKYPPVTRPDSTIYIEEGQTEGIECPLPHGITDKLRWYKNEVMIRSGRLSINDATVRDSGHYSCRVSTIERSRNSGVEVIVGYAPEFQTDVDDVVNMVPGLPVTLDCETNSIPEGAVTWYLDDELLDMTDSICFFPDGLSMPGEYKCVVENRFGHISRTFHATQLYCALPSSKLVTNNKQAPLMLNLNLTWLTPEKSHDNLILTKKSQVIFFCPNKFTKFPKKYVIAFCDGGTYFSINGVKYEYSSIKCTEEVQSISQKTDTTCMPGYDGEDTELVNIGYKVYDDFITIVYEVCFNKISNTPIYAKHVMQNSLADDEYDSPWLDSDEFEMDFEEAYDCENQIKFISFKLLDRWFHNYDGCCFSKRRLVSPKDVFPGIPQKSTFSHFNVIPHWSTCSFENWDEVERRVRNFALKLDSLLVYTGTAQELTLPTRRGRANIVISDLNNNQQTVPLYLWKVFQNPPARSSLAIIQVNVPDLDESEVSSYTLCRDQCDAVGWMRNPDWRDVEKGYTYCCKLDEFERAFGFEGLFQPDMYNLPIDSPDYD